MSILHGGTLPALSAANAQSSNQLSNGRCAGLLLWAATPTVFAKLILEAALRVGESGNETIVPKLPLLPLVERADIQGGVGFGAAWEKQNATAAATEVEDIPPVGAFISLGSILCAQKDQLSVTFSVATAFTGTEEFEWAFIEAPPGPEQLLRFSVVPSGQGIAEDPNEAYVYRTSGDAADQAFSVESSTGLNIQMRIGSNSYAPNGRMAWALTRALGEIEDGGTRRTVQIYGDHSQKRIGENVSVTLAGTNASNYNILFVERIKKAARSEVAQKALFSELAQKHSALQMRNADRFQAYSIERG